MVRRNLIAASVATSMVLVSGVAAAVTLVGQGSGESSSGSKSMTTPTVTVVQVEFLDEVVTAPPPGVVIPPDWPAGTPYPPLPVDCGDARLELTGVWTCGN